MLLATLTLVAKGRDKIKPLDEELQMVTVGSPKCIPGNLGIVAIRRGLQ